MSWRLAPQDLSEVWIGQVATTADRFVVPYNPTGPSAGPTTA